MSTWARWLLVISVLVAALAWLLVTPSASTTTDDTPSEPLLPPGDIVGILHGGVTVRDAGNGWLVITDDLAWPAAQQRVSAAQRLLSSASGRLATNAADVKNDGVIVFREADGTQGPMPFALAGQALAGERRIRLGEATPPRWLRVESRIADLLEGPNLRAWRSTTPFEVLPATAITEIDLASGDANIRLSKRGRTWQITEPVNTAAESDAVEGLIANLQAIEGSAIRSASNQTIDASGQTIRVSGRRLGASEATVVSLDAETADLFDAPRGVSTIVGLTEAPLGPALLDLASPPLTPVMLDPAAYIRRTAISQPAGDVRRVRITAGDDILADLSRGATGWPEPMPAGLDDAADLQAAFDAGAFAEVLAVAVPSRITIDTDPSASALSVIAAGLGGDPVFAGRAWLDDEGLLCLQAGPVTRCYVAGAAEDSRAIAIVARWLSLAKD
ncbi:MAG: hypothetical protein AAF747_04030 [Planctomycetota bacterium]